MARPDPMDAVLQLMQQLSREAGALAADRKVARDAWINNPKNKDLKQAYDDLTRAMERTDKLRQDLLAMLPGALLQAPGNAMEQLAEHLLPAALTAIPSLDVVQQMFSSTDNYKVPVSHLCAQLYSGTPAASLLIGVPESALTNATNFLVATLQAPGGDASKSSSTTLVQSFITNLFRVFRRCWPHSVSFAYEELPNQMEFSNAIPSTVMSTGLDAMVVSTEKRIAVFFGEGKKAGGLEAVQADLITQLGKLPLAYLGHGTLQYQLAYTVDGRIVQLHVATFIEHKDQAQVLPLGRACDLATPEGRALLIINFAKVYTVLECIVRCMPACKADFPRGGHPIKITSQHGCVA